MKLIDRVIHNRIKVEFNNCELVLKGPKAFRLLNLTREQLDNNHQEYNVYVWTGIIFRHWSKLYTINDLQRTISK